jgi:hypothetical protein
MRISERHIVYCVHAIQINVFHLLVSCARNPDKILSFDCSTSRCGPEKKDSVWTAKCGTLLHSEGTEYTDGLQSTEALTDTEKFEIG